MLNEFKLQDKIMNEIKKAAIDGALTREAITYLDGLVRSHDACQRENERLTDELKKQVTTNKSLESKIAIMDRQIATIDAREITVSEREKKMTELELNAKWAEVRVSDHREMVSLIFRANRRTLFESTNVPIKDQYGSVVYHSSSKEITETEE
ncbi:MAG: hypothetical protein KC590_16885 [Nitrospira sp.]|nr:hypothetical protein [Nitrospira sp.]